jgi:hypothetical protein
MRFGKKRFYTIIILILLLCTYRSFIKIHKVSKIKVSSDSKTNHEPNNGINQLFDDLISGKIDPKDWSRQITVHGLSSDRNVARQKISGDISTENNMKKLFNDVLSGKVDINEWSRQKLLENRDEKTLFMEFQKQLAKETQPFQKTSILKTTGNKSCWSYEMYSKCNYNAPTFPNRIGPVLSFEQVRSERQKWQSYMESFEPPKLNYTGRGVVYSGYLYSNREWIRPSGFYCVLLNICGQKIG